MSEIHSVGPFILGKSLGAGATGKVKLGFHKETGFKVAVKIINKEFLTSRPSMRKKVEREIVVMKLVDHPNVLKLYDVYETSKYLFLILEYVEGGELFDYLVSKGSLEPAEALHFFQQIIRGLDYCHSHIICHRDLKPENLLFVDSEKSIKIADFGMASLMRKSTLLQTSCGSPHYASPEVVTGSKYNGMMADIWSTGVILYALLSGKLPFDDDNIRKLLSKVRSGVFSMPAFLPKDAQDLIQKMITVDVTKRITMQAIKEHPWFNSNKPNPQIVAPLVNVEDMQADPLEDLSMIDDEILRSLKALGLGSEVDIQLALTGRSRANIILVFYRMLEARKDNQDINNLYPSANRGGSRARSNTVDRLPPPSPNLEKNRSRSLLSTPGEQSRRHRGSLGNTSPLPPSPLASNHHQHLHPRIRSNSIGGGEQRHAVPSHGSSSGYSSDNLMFPLILDGSSDNISRGRESPSPMQGVVATSAAGLIEPLTLSPASTPPSSPKYNRRRQNSLGGTANLGNPTIPPQLNLDSSAPSQPVNISDKLRRLRLASETTIVAGSPGSPIIGSNPKRSWFSNFFSGSPATSPRGETIYTMQTVKDGVELAAEVQRTLSTLKTSWRLADEDLYKAEYKTTDGTNIKFSLEVMNSKSKQNADIRVVVLTLREGPVPYFNFLCAQLHNEINL